MRKAVPIADNASWWGVESRVRSRPTRSKFRAAPGGAWMMRSGLSDMHCGAMTTATTGGTTECRSRVANRSESASPGKSRTRSGRRKEQFESWEAPRRRTWPHCRVRRPAGRPCRVSRSGTSGVTAYGEPRRRFWSRRGGAECGAWLTQVLDAECRGELLAGSAWHSAASTSIRAIQPSGTGRYWPWPAPVRRVRPHANSLRSTSVRSGRMPG